MVILKNILTNSAITLLAASSVAAMPHESNTTHALQKRNGCYKNGPTFAQFGINSLDFIYAACGILQGDYQQAQSRSFCWQANGGKIDFAITRFGHSSSAHLTEGECQSGFKTEYNGCQHGSEQDHNQWHYYIDPNDGNC
jgi:hypothetical protein